MEEKGSLHTTGEDKDDERADVNDDLVRRETGNDASMKRMRTEENDKKADDNEERDVPIDRGWAWMIVLGCFLIYFLFASFFFVISVLFLDLMSTFNTPATTVTLLLSIRGIVYCISTQLMVNLVMPRVSVRKMALVATVVSVLSTLLFAAFPLLPIFFVSTIFKAIADGAALVPSLTLVGLYFQRRRALAMAIAMLGISSASILVPPMTRYLRDEFGLRGAFLIMSAVEMNALFAAMILRALSSYRRKGARSKSGEIAMDSVKISDSHVAGDSNTANNNYANPVIQSGADLNKEENEDGKDDEEKEPMLAEQVQKGVTPMKTLTHEYQLSKKSVPGTDGTITNGVNPNIDGDCTSIDRHDPVAQNTDISAKLSVLDNGLKKNLATFEEGSGQMSTEEDKMITSKTDVNAHRTSETVSMAQSVGSGWSIVSIPITGSPVNVDELVRQTSVDVTGDKSKAKHSWGPRLRMILNSLLDVQLLKNYLAILQLVSFTLNSASVYASAYLPSHAVKMGVPQTNAAILLTIVGVVDVFTRVGFGYFADLGYVRPGRLIAGAVLIVGLTCQFSGLYTSFGSLVFMAVVCGAVGFVPLGLNSPLIIDLVGVDNLGKMLALDAILVALTSFIQHPLHGVLIETTDSFVASFHFIGTSYILGGLCLLAEPLVRRLQTAREGRAKTKRNS